MSNSQSNSQDFFSAYFDYVSGTETPIIFHRWSTLVGISALLGRNYSLPFGHTIIYPNMYCMLIGAAGTKKSSAIKLIKKLLILSGYTTFAAEKTTKEKFLLDLAGEDSIDNESGNILDAALWKDTGTPAECFIAADEFNDFFGNNGLEFISLLGSLWDFSGEYKSRVKNSKSVIINNPTITILGGNTPTGFNAAFPPEILGQGFFSRLLLIYGEPTGKKITFPRIPSDTETAEIISYLHRIKFSALGVMEISHEAKLFLDKIYQSWRGLEDVRFDSYSNRRFIHLLKLCLVISAARFSSTLSELDVLYANTILSHAEHLMPRALGEFGKARNSDVVHKIIQILDTALHPMKSKDIWKLLSNDLEKPTDLTQLLGGLQVADKIISTADGFLLKRKIIDVDDSNLIDLNLLTKEERKE